MLYTLVKMEIIVKEERENPFFNRKELKLIIKHHQSPTPSREELKEELAKRYSCDKSQVLIDHIFSKKGICEAIAKVKILKEKPKIEEKEKIKKEEKNEAQTSKAVEVNK